MRKSASRGSKIAPDFCISGRFLCLWACPALRAARFRRGSKASGGRDGACGGEKAPLFPGRMPIRGGVPGKTGRREGKRRAALDAVGWLPPGGLLPRGSRGTGGVCAEGPGGEGREHLPLGGCASALGDARSFCGAKSRSLMAAAMAGQGKTARSFCTRLLMGLSASDAVGWLPRGLLPRGSRGTGKAFARRAPVGRDGRGAIARDRPRRRGFGTG